MLGRSSGTIWLDANKFAPTNSKTIYSKIGQALLNSSLDQWNEIVCKYAFALCILFCLPYQW